LTKKLISNPCPTCGKERVTVKTYQEYIGNSLVEVTITSCPDPKCQQARNRQLAKEKKFRAEMKRASERRIQERKERKANESY